MLWAACLAWSSTKAEQHIKDQITMFSCHFESWSRCFVFFYSFLLLLLFLFLFWFWLSLLSCVLCADRMNFNFMSNKELEEYTIWWKNCMKISSDFKISSISCLFYIFFQLPQKNIFIFIGINQHSNFFTNFYDSEAVPLNGNHIISRSMNQAVSMIRDVDFLRGWTRLRL